MGQTTELKSADGFTFPAYVAEPSGKPRGGLVVLQEIFGVNSHIRSVADGYAADGYFVVAPATFHRAKAGVELGYTEADMNAGFGLKTAVEELPAPGVMPDIQAAIDHAAQGGKVGIVGYCWGGTVAWKAAAEVAGLACSSPHYGGGIPNHASLQAKCPVMFHWGEKDQSITLEAAQKVQAAQPQWEHHFYPAGHGFNCDQRGSFDAASAKLARERTLAFLRKHVG